MKVPKKFFGFYYIFLEEDSWRFLKMDKFNADIQILKNYDNNFLKSFEEPFGNISKILRRKYL
jgi:hypothetical protein